MRLVTRLWRALPEPVRAPIRLARHGETAFQHRLRRRAHEIADWAGQVDGEGQAVAGSALRPRRAQIVDHYDAWAERDRLVDGLGGVLSRAGIAWVRPPVNGVRPPVVAISDIDRRAALAALAAAPETADWWLSEQVGERRRWSRPSVRGADGSPRADAVIIHRMLVSPSGVVLNDESWHVRLEFWETLRRGDVPRPDGGLFEAGTRVARVPNGSVAYLQSDEWENASGSRTHWLLGARPDLRTFTDPIDVVYTWVDGSDPDWIERKLHAQGILAAGEHHDDSLAANRFLSRDELKYSLRSVEMFASWVNHIWIVTDRQVPPWLDTSHPKVTVVDHREIFADPTALPVFNSHAIESQLHHIDGLAEHYLYMNDDVFFGRPVTAEVFFHGNGIARFFPSTAVLDVTPRSVNDFAVASAAKRNRELIERDFGRTVLTKQRHTPHAQLRSVLQEMEQSYPEVFDQVMRSRFRHPDDYAIPSALAHQYAFATGRAVNARVTYGYQDISAPNAALVLARWRRQRRLECFCLNDTADEPHTAERRDRVVRDFLESYFPVRSGFELP